MNQIKTLLLGIVVSVVLCLVPAAGFGQVSVEPSYEVSLHLLVGSNETGSKETLPPNLLAVSQNLKTNFAFSNYRLGATFLGRVSNTGDFNYKSLSNIFGKETDFKSQSFLEWSVRTLQSAPTAKGGQGFHARTFIFGARVPVTTMMVKDKEGMEQPFVNYEPIGLTLNKLGLPENVPTLVGTLNLPGANDTIFLVMTVKPVDL